MPVSDYFSQSSSSSPIALVRRPDVVIREVTYQGEPCWICKDPLDQVYHRLNEQEHAIYQWLDGNVSFDELKDRFEAEFTPFRVNLNELAQLLGDFHERSLVIATDANQGEKLLEMGRDKERKELKQKLMSIYAIKWKGIDPEVFLNATNAWVRPFFSKQVVCVVLAMVVTAATWLLLHHEQVMSRVPDLWTFLDSSNWASLGLAIIGSKFLHEFGHAYAFKRFGGEVHEIGVMVFFFMPTMYCNTSDSWMLVNKWKRIAIAMGGVYVELVVFSIATFVWWFAGPGAIQDISLNLMFVCSLSTVFINGNPLLKYDGYFALADFMEIPNLAQESSGQIQKQFMVHALGITDEETPWVSRFNRRFMIAYGIGAYCFRMSLMLGVAYFMVVQAAPYGMAPIALLFSLVTTTVFLIMPVYQLLKKLQTPGTMIKIKRKNLQIFTAIVVGITVLLFIPFPYYVRSECTLDDGGAGTVITKESGVLKTRYVRPGDSVRKGDVIIELLNSTLEREIAEIQQQISTTRVEIANKQHDLYSSNPQEVVSVASLQDKLASLQVQLQHLSARYEMLKVKAPIDGWVIGTKAKSQSMMMSDERSLKTDHGNILVNKESTWLSSGVEICRIRPNSETQATLTIKQFDQDLVNAGQNVQMLFRANPNTIYEGSLDSLSQETENPRDLVDFEAEGATVKSIADQHQLGSPVNSDGASMESAVIMARCSFESTQTIPFGSTGAAKIYVGPRSTFWRIKRMILLFINTKL